MKALSDTKLRCVSVDVVEFPNVLLWTLEDGTKVETDCLDLTENGGRATIAALAHQRGLGDRASIYSYLRGWSGVGRLLPMVHSFDLDDEFPAV